MQLVDQPNADVQKTDTDDTSPLTESPVPFPGTAQELRWSRFGPHLPLGTLTASNPITQAEVNLIKAKVQSYNARKSMEEWTHKHRAALVRLNRYHDSPDSDADKQWWQGRVSACEEVRNMSRQLFWYSRVEMVEAKKALRALGGEVEISPSDLTLDHNSPRPPPTGEDA
jgi:hypothetical protein